MSLSPIHEILTTTNLRAYELQQGFRQLSDPSNCTRSPSTQSDQTVNRVSAIQEQQIRCDIRHRIATINHRIHSTFLNVKRNDSKKSVTLQSTNTGPTNSTKNVSKIAMVNASNRPKSIKSTKSAKKDLLHTNLDDDKYKVSIRNATQKDCQKQSDTKIIVPESTSSILDLDVNSFSKPNKVNRVTHKVEVDSPSPVRVEIEETSTAKVKCTLVPKELKDQFKSNLPNQLSTATSSNLAKVNFAPRPQNHKLDPNVLRKLFNDLDADNDGALNRIEVCIAMHRLQLSISTEQITAFFRRLHRRSAALGQVTSQRSSMGTNALYEVINYKQFAAFVVAVVANQQNIKNNEQQERLLAWKLTHNKVQSMTSIASLNEPDSRESITSEQLSPIIDRDCSPSDSFERHYVTKKLCDCASSPIQSPQPIIKESEHKSESQTENTIVQGSDTNGDHTSSKCDNFRTDQLIALILYEVCCRKDPLFSQSARNEVSPQNEKKTQILIPDVVERGIQTSMSTPQFEDTHDLRSELRGTLFEFFRELRETIQDTAAERVKWREVAKCYHSSKSICQSDTRISMHPVFENANSLQKDDNYVSVDKRVGDDLPVEGIDQIKDTKKLDIIDLTENSCVDDQNITVSSHAAKLSIENLDGSNFDIITKDTTDANRPELPNLDRKEEFSASMNVSEQHLNVIYSESSSSSSDLTFISHQSTYYLRAKNHCQTYHCGRSTAHKLQDTISDGEVCNGTHTGRLSDGEVPSFVRGYRTIPARHRVEMKRAGSYESSVGYPAMRSSEPGELLTEVRISHHHTMSTHTFF